MAIDENTPWAKLPTRIRSAVLREMHDELARHFVGMEMAMRIKGASAAAGEEPPSAPTFTDRVALHTSEMIVGYQAAIGALLGGSARESDEET